MRVHDRTCDDREGLGRGRGQALRGKRDRVSDVGVGDQGLGFWGWGAWFRMWGSRRGGPTGARYWFPRGFGFQVQDSGFGLPVSWCTPATPCR